MIATAAATLLSYASTFFSFGRRALEALQGYDYLATHNTKSVGVLFWLFSPQGAQLFTLLFLAAFFVAFFRTFRSLPHVQQATVYTAPPAAQESSRSMDTPRPASAAPPDTYKQLLDKWKMEKAGLTRQITDRDKQIAALNKELERYKNPKVSLIYKPEHPYKRVFPSPDGKQQRTEFYIGVICHTAINDLRVDIEWHGEGGKVYPRVPLNVEDGAASDAGEPPYEKLFFLAEQVPDGTLKYQVDTPERSPLGFNVVVSGSNTLPLKNAGHFGRSGLYGPTAALYLGS
jgi:hypothetical protein